MFFQRHKRPKLLPGWKKKQGAWRKFYSTVLFVTCPYYRRLYIENNNNNSKNNNIYLRKIFEKKWPHTKCSTLLVLSRWNSFSTGELINTTRRCTLIEHGRSEEPPGLWGSGNPAGKLLHIWPLTFYWLNTILIHLTTDTTFTSLIALSRMQQWTSW